MSITVTKANFTRTLYRVIMLAGMQDPDYSVPTVKEGAPFSLNDFKEAVHQSAIEIQLMVADCLGHPYRNNYFTETPININYGDKIPSALAAHSKVSITANSITKPGRRARNRTHVERCIENPEIFGEGNYKYFIEHGLLYFVGTSAAIYSPTVELDREAVEVADTLNLPDAWSNGIVFNSFKQLYMKGQDASQINHYTGIFQKVYAPKILGNDEDMPKPETFQMFNN
jgi:hypothetical protein